MISPQLRLFYLTHAARLIDDILSVSGDAFDSLGDGKFFRTVSTPSGDCDEGNSGPDIHMRAQAVNIYLQCYQSCQCRETLMKQNLWTSRHLGPRLPAV